MPRRRSLLDPLSPPPMQAALQAQSTERISSLEALLNFTKEELRAALAAGDKTAADLSAAIARHNTTVTQLQEELKQATTSVTDALRRDDDYKQQVESLQAELDKATEAKVRQSEFVGAAARPGRRTLLTSSAPPSFSLRRPASSRA